MNEQQGMKWYKFIVYIQLYAMAFLNLLTAMRFVTGAQYGNDSTGAPVAEVVYDYYGKGLKVIDTGIGIVSILLALFYIFVRIQLKNFRRQAPGLYITALAAGAGVNILYIVAVMIYTGQNLIQANMVSSIAGSVVIAVLSYIYFQKRQSMFVN